MGYTSLRHTWIFAILLLCVTVQLARSGPVSPTPPQHISSQDMLGAHERFRMGRTTLQTDPITLRVLALRVDFVPDSLQTTTGDGQFLYGANDEETYRFDPPPHNRTYFQHQLLALSNYFKTASKGKLILNSHVFPTGERESYSLPQNMVYYSGQEDEELKKQRWAELLRDAVNLADQDAGIEWSDYDVVVLFHAGVGSDFAFDFDSTPYDIQSVFLDTETLKETLGTENPDFECIETDDGSTIREALILPEMQNQEEQDLGLLGTMTLLMGSQLGMPSLFNTENGRAGIGRWGLMDQGSYNFFGLIPALPSAWMRVFMGWEKPVVINQPQDIQIASFGAAGESELYKIPISSTEYYLIENRQQDPNNDGIATARDENGNRVEFDTTGVVTMEGGVGVLVHVDEYDFGLPGSGVLIWHVDETVIADHLADNTINNDRDHRGVDLVECDGAQDIGYYFGFFHPASGAQNGDYYDPYWSGNASHKIVNDAETVEFSSTSVPPSKSHSGGYTHLRLTAFSARDSLMQVRVENEWIQTGFDRVVWSGEPVSRGAMLDLETAARHGIAMARRDGTILAWSASGDPWLQTGASEETLSPLGERVEYDLALLTLVSDSIEVPLSGADWDGDGSTDLFVASSGDTLSVFSLQDRDGNGTTDRLYALDLGASPTTAPVIRSGQDVVAVGTLSGMVLLHRDDDQSLQYWKTVLGDMTISGIAIFPQSESGWIVSTTEGSVFRLTMDGSIVWSYESDAAAARSQPVIADFNGDSFFECIVIWDSGRFVHLDAEGTVITERMDFPYFPYSSPLSLGDPDGDSQPEIMFASLKSLSSFEATGWTTLDFPVALSESSWIREARTAPLWMSSPEPETSVTWAGNDKGLLYGIDAYGTILPSTPLTTGAAEVNSTLLFDMDRDGDVELCAITAEGFLSVWDLPYTSSDSRWGQYGGSRDRHFSWGQQWNPTGVKGRLMPEKKVFCYPNPSENGQTRIRYTLSQNADQVSIRLYDLAGEYVTSLPAPGMRAGDHEVIWNVTDVESGVYMARIEASTPSSSQVRFVKIAVVK